MPGDAERTNEIRSAAARARRTETLKLFRDTSSDVSETRDKGNRMERVVDER